MASSAFDIAATAAKITTIGQLRAAMGAVTLTLSQAYARLPDISRIAGEKDEAKFLLDTVNKSARLLYNKYTDDPDLQDQEISTWNATLAGQVVSQANDALATVEQAANEKLWDISSIVNESLAKVGGAVGGTFETATNGIVAGVAAFAHSARTTLIIIGVVGAIYVFRGPILRQLQKVAT